MNLLFKNIILSKNKKDYFGQEYKKDYLRIGNVIYSNSDELYSITPGKMVYFKNDELVIEYNSKYIKYKNVKSCLLSINEFVNPGQKIAYVNKINNLYGVELIYMSNNNNTIDWNKYVPYNEYLFNSLDLMLIPLLQGTMHKLYLEKIERNYVFYKISIKNINYLLKINMFDSNDKYINTIFKPEHYWIEMIEQINKCIFKINYNRINLI